MSVRWLPLESNPEIMNEYMWNIGVSRKVQFSDVYSLDETDLQALLPSPIYAFILLYPIESKGNFDALDRSLGLSELEAESQCAPFYLKQTIDNACGFIAMLHALAATQDTFFSNTCTETTNLIQESTPLHNYMVQARGLSASDRGSLLERCEELASQHRRFAQQGSTTAPQTLEEEMAVNLHFVALVPGRDGKSLWELDGRKKGPVLRASPETSNGFVSESLKLIKYYMERGSEAGDATVEYSVIALVPHANE